MAGFKVTTEESFTAGMSDAGEISDIASGMEQVLPDSEFHSLLKAHVKSIGLRPIIGDELLSEAKARPGLQDGL
jgi:hypothetical protein